MAHWYACTPTTSEPLTLRADAVYPEIVLLVMGCVIALVPVDAVATVTDGVREAFASAGFTEPGTFTVRPVAGASRIEVTP